MQGDMQLIWSKQLLSKIARCRTEVYKMEL